MQRITLLLVLSFATITVMGQIIIQGKDGSHTLLQDGAVKNKTTAPVSSKIILQGEGVDSVLLANHSSVRELVVYQSTFGSNNATAPSIRNEFKVGYNVPFKKVFETTTEFSYVTFMLSSFMENSKYLNLSLTSWSDHYNTYMLERGDSVYCKLSSKGYVFSGRGADKLNCQSEIYAIRHDLDEDLHLLPQGGVHRQEDGSFLFSEEEGLTPTGKAKKYEDYFDKIRRSTDTALNLQLAIVNKYASKLGKKMASIMVANCYGWRYIELLQRRGKMGISLVSNPVQDEEKMKAFANSKAFQSIKLDLVDDMDAEILVCSPVYCDAIFEKIINDNGIDKDGRVLSFRSEKLMELVFNAIEKNYEGIVRQKLFTLFFLRSKTADLDYLDRALSYTKNTGYREILIGVKNAKSKGAPFFPFELQDANGKIVKLTDFKDKVVILEFWFTGCPHCLTRHQWMIPVYEKYKNNPKLKFVNISTDEDKVYWVKSIEKREYTYPQSINLYTNGLGTKHPIIEKSGVKGYPTTFILKNGKMFSYSPFTLKGSSTNEDTMESFVRLIEEALAN